MDCSFCRKYSLNLESYREGVMLCEECIERLAIAMIKRGEVRYVNTEYVKELVRKGKIGKEFID